MTSASHPFHVLIRTDASASIGIGHLIRCLNLAAALRDAGATVMFACAQVSAASEEMCRVRGFKPTPIAATDPAEDARSSAALAAGRPFDWVVVDHYGLDAIWERAMRRACHQIMAIEDFADRPHDCDLLLNQNLREDYEDVLPNGCERLLGPRFALLDGSFAAARAALTSQPRDRVLVSFGGSDPQSMTAPVLRALRRALGDRYGIDVVVGPMQREATAIRDLAANAPGVEVHYAIRDMAKLMARAQLFVGAGGTTSWERCCLGLPGIVASAADNQVALCTALHDAGSHVYVGPTTQATPDAMAAAASAVLACPAWSQRLSERSFALVDGLGAQRVARRLQRGRMQVRSASPHDESKVLLWRNDPAVRRFSGSGAEIGAAEHADWYARKLGDPDCHLLIGEDARGEAGVVRYDVAANVAKVSVYVRPERLGTGTGAALLAAGERWLSSHCPSVDAISADVRADNEASIRLFAGAGYRACAHRYIRSLAGRRSA